METAKVDIKKLQLLNDRISQCIDALNQVRLSVHGLSHASTIGVGGLGISPGMGAIGAEAQDPRLASLQLSQIPSPWATGLGHSSVPFGGQFANPYSGYATAPGGIGQTPFAQTAFGPPFLGTQGFAPQFGGLSHSSLDLEAYTRPTWADPFLAAKVAQTFPYARYAVPPVVSIY